jgi:hypothetical protein
MGMQKPFQNWLHTGAICTVVVEFAPHIHRAGPGFQEARWCNQSIRMEQRGRRAPE